MRQKGYNPHILVMTATPMPRTLSLTLYGDLDLSVIDSLPPGRQSIKTKWLTPGQRASAYRFIAKQVAEGRQVFIICPLIKESEAVQAKAAAAEYERLSKEVFPDLKLGLLHGRLPDKEKNNVMQSFRSGEYSILVATPVIEVGIDVPNATVMLVESADRFGLSQLHQFRGRVGRGQAQSYCMLLADDPSAIGRQRLDIIERVQDGFVLAEEDLKLRGPGEFFGTRQSGLPDLRMAMLSDTKLLETARREATGLFNKDPDLKRPGKHLASARVNPCLAQRKTGRVELMMSKKSSKQRIDTLLVARGLVETRNKAQAMLMAGEVLVNGQPVLKAGIPVPEDAQISILKTPPFVGRGGLKLEHALAEFNLDVAGKVAADIGASTGGFTDCLLQRGTIKVYAIDVGTNQLNYRLRQDSRVVVMEGVNARYPLLVPEKVDIAVIDLSFISVEKVIPVVKTVLKEDGYIIVLIKPQFEARREEVGRGGIIKDPAVHARVLGRFIDWFTKNGFRLGGLTASPITGSSGNREFLLLLTMYYNG